MVPHLSLRPKKVQNRFSSAAQIRSPEDPGFAQNVRSGWTLLRVADQPGPCGLPEFVLAQRRLQEGQRGVRFLFESPLLVGLHRGASWLREPPVPSVGSPGSGSDVSLG